MDHTPPPPHVLIIGGGLAGLATASALVNRGLRLTILESRPRLGGRAGSFTDPVTGELVDNCQHVSMTCCTNLDDFCRRVGIADLFRHEESVTFLGPDGRLSELRAGAAPAPLHLASSFLKAKYLSWGDKLRVAYGLARLATDDGDRPGQSFADWLLKNRQTVRTINLFWSTVLVSALNERIDQMDHRHARKVFLDGFLLNKTGHRIEIPTAPLGELYGTRMESWLANHGVETRLTTGVRSIDCDEQATLRGVTLRTGESIDADFVVSTVPFDRVAGLLGESSVARIPGLEGVKKLSSSPITGIHLWFNCPVCPLDHVVTPGRLIQWVFNHTAVQGRKPAEAENGQYLQLVVSAAYDLVSMSRAEIRDAALAELAEIWPAAREAKLLRWWIVTEHGATFAARPGVDALRPPQRTPIDGFFFAGDWTRTGWPGTMEGAVRSGYLAAEGILRDLDTPAQLVRPGLKSGRLARWLIKGECEAPAEPHAQRRLGGILALPREPSAEFVQKPNDPRPAVPATLPRRERA